MHTKRFMRSPYIHLKWEDNSVVLEFFYSQYVDLTELTSTMNENNKGTRRLILVTAFTNIARLLNSTMVIKLQLVI